MKVARLATNTPKNREILPESLADWQRLEDARSVLNWKILARQLKNSSPSADRSDASIIPSGSALLP